MLRIYLWLAGSLTILLLIGTRFVSPAAVLGFQAIPDFDAAFVVMAAGMLLTLPSGLVSGLYRARGLYGRAVRLQNWGALAGQLGQLAAIIATGSLLAVTIAFAATQLLTALYLLVIDGPRQFPFLREGRARHSWVWTFGQFRKAAPFAVASATELALVNLPVLLLAPDAWFSFWQYNADRGGDFGSIWYVLSLAGHPVPYLNWISGGLFLLCCLGILILILYAPRRPRFGAVAFLVIAAFLMTNKVYSPQYVLWLLPLMILARPRWRDWLIFTAGELIYFVAIWWHLGGFLTPGDSSPDRIYWLSVLIRLCTQGWVVIMVVRDAVRPAHDPVRREGVDDPTGGVLDQAPDARWYRVFAGTAVPRRNA